MSAADDAFAAAEAKIEKVRVEGSETLDLAYEEFAALERLLDSIGRLDKLRVLVLGDSKAHVAVTDLSPLTGLTGLTGLSLNNSQVTDLSPLTGLTGLTGLRLNNSQVTDLSPLSGLTGLTGLYLNNSQVTDLSPLSGLTGLTRLDLDNSQVTDLSPLSSLTGLTELWLNNSQVTDLSPLSGLTGLTRLSLDNSEVTDLSPLSGLTGLTELWLNDSQVTDLSPLSGLTGLSELSLDNSQVTDLSPLSGLTGLSELSLDNSQVTDLRPIGALRQFAEVEGEFGLTFKGCGAAQADARIAEIAEIENGGQRAAALFAYLEDWVPPVPGDVDAAQVFTLPDDGPVRPTDFAPEGDDNDQAALQADLRRKVADLIEATGGSNELGRLKAAAEHYQRQIAKPLGEIRPTLLYSAGNTLRTAYEGDQRAEALGRIKDQLPANIAVPLQDAVETHALFFMGLPNSAEIHQKMLAGLTWHRNASEVVAVREMVETLEGEPKALDAEDSVNMRNNLREPDELPSLVIKEINEFDIKKNLWNLLLSLGRRLVRDGFATAAIGITSFALILSIYPNFFEDLGVFVQWSFRRLQQILQVRPN